MTTTPDVRPIPCMIPGPGRVTVTVRVDYHDGPLRGSGDLFVRYVDPEDYDEDVRLASAMAAGALMDLDDRELRSLLIGARDEWALEGVASGGVALVKVDGHVLYEETLHELWNTLERYEERSCRGDWRIGGGF